MAEFGFDIRGRNVYLWAEEKKGFTAYKVSWKNTNKNGETEYMPIEVTLPKDCEGFPNKTMINFDGFPTFRTYLNAAEKKVYVPRIVMTRIWLADENTPTYADPDKRDSYEELDKKVKDAFGDLPDVSFNEVTDEIPF